MSWNQSELRGSECVDDESIELEETENYRLEEVEEEETQVTPVYRMKSVRKILGGFAQRS